MAKGVDPDCLVLAACFLGDSYKGSPPSEEQADEDLRSLGEAIQAAIDDWFFSKERED